MAGGEVQIVAPVQALRRRRGGGRYRPPYPSGEFFSILGPSGCGKTTTLRLVAGFEQPTSGSIYLDGVDVADKPPHKRNVNTVFQSYALFPFLSVADNVAFGLRYQRLTKAESARRVGAALELVQLLGYEKRRPGQLSGGQQQRVALARALVLNPAVLLLDEPLGALDAKLRRTLQIELKALQETVGITFLYVTHDQEEALTMSDRLAVMESGQGGPGGHAGRGLRGAGGCLRRRLPGRVQPDGRPRRRTGRRWCVPDHAGDVRAGRRAGLDRLRRPGEGGRPTGAGHHRTLRATGPNRVPAMVERLVFLGSSTQVIMRLAHGQTVQALLQNQGGPPAYQQGTAVQVHLPADGLRVLPSVALAPRGGSPPCRRSRCPPCNRSDNRVQPPPTDRSRLTCRRCWSWPPGDCCPARRGSSTGRRRDRFRRPRKKAPA